MRFRHFNCDDTVRTLTAVAAGLVLAACSPDEGGKTAGQKLDQAVASASQKSAEMANEAAAAGKDLAHATTQGFDQAADKVNDAAITAAINAKLAMDGKLSAINIDVDTSGGQVVLRGTAPDDRARENATQLAMSVDGVRGVDNQLVLAGKSDGKT